MSELASIVSELAMAEEELAAMTDPEILRRKQSLLGEGDGATGRTLYKSTRGGRADG